MKIAYATTYDARDISQWSGLGLHIGNSLRNEGHEVDFVGPLKKRKNILFSVRRRIDTQLLGKIFITDREPLAASDFAKQVDRRVEACNADLILTTSAPIAAKLSNQLPVVIWMDATFQAVIDLYWGRHRISARQFRNGQELERSGIAKASVVFCSSSWAAASVVEDYGADRSKVLVIPFGANSSGFTSPDEVSEALALRSPHTIELLFVGIDWTRKGGHIAVDVARILKERGRKTRLTVVGCTPPGLMPSFVNVAGFVNKATSAGRLQYEDILKRAHFLILPTRAEAYGLVLCEACAVGVPCVTTNVGGIGEIIRDDLNGRKFAFGDATSMANYIYDVMADFSRYSQLCRGAFQEYCQRLNWNVAGSAATAAMQKIFVSR